MQSSFAEKLAGIQHKSRSQIALLMAPRLTMLPMPMQRYDDPFLPFGKEIVRATCGVVCAYVFDLAAYLALGAAGAVALERSIAFVSGDAMTILHAPFASADYVTAVGETGFNVDAVTLVDEQHFSSYLANPARGAFVVRRGESPVIVPFPPNAGVFWEEAGLFTLVSASGHTLNMQLAGEKVLYAGRGDDFAERVRAAVETLR